MGKKCAGARWDTCKHHKITKMAKITKIAKNTDISKIA